MSEKEVKKCPKCGEEMRKGILRGGFYSPKIFFEQSPPSTWWPKTKKMNAFCCLNCGYIELYKEVKEKKE